MPVSIKKIDSKWRIVEITKETKKDDKPKIVKNKSGTPVDGGGHSVRSKAVAQARAINIAMKKSKDKSDKE